MPAALAGVGLAALARLAPSIAGRLGLGIGQVARGATGSSSLARGTRSLIGAAGTGAAFGAAMNVLDGGGLGFGGGGGQVSGPIDQLEPGMIFPTGEVVGKVWSTNGQSNNMGMTFDGKKGIAVRNDGTVRIFRYQKHIVVSSNPRARSLNRAARRIDRLTSGLVKTATASKRAGGRMKGK